MLKVHRISGKVRVGGQPGREDLRRLRAQGFTAVVNLRVDGEAEGMPGVREEGDQADRLGLAYHHPPVALAALASDQVAALATVIEAAPGPVYVHSDAGQRACALALLATTDVPVDVGTTAAEFGLPIVDARLKRFVQEHAAATADRSSSAA